MSIETKCPNCGEEHDMRHDGCPVCTIDVQIRQAIYPYQLVKTRGYLPFEIFAEKFAAHESPAPINEFQKWRVTHLDTGAALPNCLAPTAKEAVERAKQQLVTLGSIKVKAAIEKIRKRIPSKP
jgi:hypothetical protein